MPQHAVMRVKGFSESGDGRAEAHGHLRAVFVFDVEPGVVALGSNIVNVINVQTEPVRQVPLSSMPAACSSRPAQFITPPSLNNGLLFRTSFCVAASAIWKLWKC